MRVFVERLKRWVFGPPVATDSAVPVVLRTRLALPVFGAGVLSTVAYAPDALVDALSGGHQFGAVTWMAAGVVLIVLLVGFAYRSSVAQFPQSGGDYGVVSLHLGQRAGVVSGAALLVDYLLTVAVSVGVLTHVFSYLVPSWGGWEPLVGVGVIALMTVATLRGVRERARVLVAVWFGFALVVIALAVLGLLNPGEPAMPTPGDSPTTTWAIVLAYAGAVASGAVMATGVEHLAASGPFHAEPRGRRAGRTLLVAVSVSAVLFFVVVWVAKAHGVDGREGGPVLLQVADAIGASPAVVWLVGIAAVAVLYAAASAVFRRFSTLASSLARDGFLPRQLHTLNDRLVLQGGILLIGAASALVIVASYGDVERLIHLYIVGVFTSIVLTQVAMLRYWNRQVAVETVVAARRSAAWHRVLHAVTLLVSVSVLLVVAVVNFLAGAWIAVALMVALVTLMHGIHRHYGAVAKDVAVDEAQVSAPLPSATHGVVLVSQLHQPALRALAYAKASRHSSLKAIVVQVDKSSALAIAQLWGTKDIGVPLVVLDSPFRDPIGPVLDYVRSIRRDSPRDVVVVYVPEYILGRWWEKFLHNKTSARIRARLLNLPGVVVTAVPWHLESARASEEAEPTT